MSKTFNLRIINEYTNDDRTISQTVVDDYNEYYWVDHLVDNLDAFFAEDYIETLKLGMSLAKEGYTGISVDYEQATE